MKDPHSNPTGSRIWEYIAPVKKHSEHKTGIQEASWRHMLPFFSIHWTGGGRDNLIESRRGEAAPGNMHILKALGISKGRLD